MENKIKNPFVKTLVYLIEIFVITISVFPVLWVIVSAFKTNSEILSGAFTAPSGLTVGIDAFKYLFEQYSFLTYFRNSLIVSLISTVLSIFFFCMAAYALAKFNFPGKNIIFALFTITMLVPAHAKAQPIFSLINKMEMYDTLFGLTVVYLSMGIAMSIFVLRAAFAAIPKELDEAARLDGAGFFRTFIVVNLPLAKGGISTAAILMFLNNWNEYFFASLLTTSDTNRTLPIALQFFSQSFSYDYTKMFAALTLVVLPGIVLYCCAQEQVQASVAASGVKG